jgi:hypothetical protein
MKKHFILTLVLLVFAFGCEDTTKTKGGPPVAPAYKLTDAEVAEGTSTKYGLITPKIYTDNLSVGSGAPTDVDYLVGTADGNLSAEEVVSANGLALVKAANYAAMKGLLDLEIGTDVLAQQTIGIADDNLLEMDDADAAENDILQLTTNGAQGLSYAELAALLETAIEGLDLDLTGTLDFSGATAFSTGPITNPDDILMYFGTDLDFTIGYDETTDDALEITSDAAGDTDITIANAGAGVTNLSIDGAITEGGTALASKYLAAQTIGIADDNLLEMDDAGPAASGDFVRLTANGAEGRSPTEVAAELDGEDWTFTGAIDLTGASSVAIGPIVFADATTAPSEVGEFRYVNNATGFDDGLFTWYDDDEVQYILSFPTLPTTDGEFMVYDDTDDQFEPVAMSGDATMSETGAVTLATDSVSYGQTDGSYKAQTPLAGDADDFDDNFTGAYLYGGTYVCSATGTILLPDATAGMNFTVLVPTAIAVDFEPLATGTDDTISLNGVDETQGEAIDNSSTAGAMCVFQYYAANKWLAICNDFDGSVD